MVNLNVKEKQGKAYDLMKKDFGYTNKMASPRLLKVVLNAGTGSGMKGDSKRNEKVAERLSKISAQKPTFKGAKQSIASFKIRQGDPIGVMVTLRGKRMYDFLEKFLNVALPRTKDFRGINRSAVDEMGNLTIGIKEHTIFPETADEDIKDVFGLSLTIVSTAKNRKEGLEFFTLLGVPFKKEKVK